MTGFLIAALGLGVSLGIYLAMAAAPAESFQSPELARIVFFHLPCALISSLFLVLGAAFAAARLVKGGAAWDRRSHACIEIAFVFGLLALATGIIFSKVQWGAYWSWDPRQTSFLLVMLIVGAYFALRSAFADEARRGAVSAAYALASLLPILFLVFVYPRIVTTLHPDVVREGGFDNEYRVVFLVNLAAILGVAAWLYNLRVRCASLESNLEETLARLADRDRPAAVGVVRPVSLSSED